jgi:histidinol-phosphate aminotransferase
VTARTAPRPLPRHLEGLERYEPGLAIEHVETAPGVRRIVKLASNENPFGPSPRALAAVAAALPNLHRYPDGPAVALREALAGRLGVSAEQVAVGNGSTDLIDLLARAFLGPEHNAVISERAFARFAQVVRARNGHARLVPMRDDRHDLGAMAATVDRDTRLVYVANPNNPTGTWNRRDEIDSLVAALPPGALVVLDEAYFEFARGEDAYPDGLDYVRRGAPVVVVRTFSKAHGLAGLRVGYGVGAPEIIAAIDTVREPFNSNSLAQAGALAALFDDDHVAKAVALNRAERPRVEAELRRRGLRSLPSLANFLCVDTGRDGPEIFRRLLRRGVIVRPLRAYGMPAWLRVSIGSVEDDDVFLEALDVVLEELPSA